jgi:hypothetical protein
MPVVRDFNLSASLLHHLVVGNLIKDKPQYVNVRNNKGT